MVELFERVEFHVGALTAATSFFLGQGGNKAFLGRGFCHLMENSGLGCNDERAARGFHGVAQQSAGRANEVRAFQDRVFALRMRDQLRIGMLSKLLFDAAEEAVARHYAAPTGLVLRAAQIAAAALPSPKTLNVALLGLLSAHLALPDEAWRAALRAGLPARLHEINLQAFGVGRAAGGKERVS